MTIRIVTDSTSDLPGNVAQKWAISTTPVYINIDGKSYLDGIDLSRSEFYARLPGPGRLGWYVFWEAQTGNFWNYVRRII